MAVPFQQFLQMQQRREAEEAQPEEVEDAMDSYSPETREKVSARGSPAGWARLP